jgi:hypothetical protein
MIPTDPQVAASGEKTPGPNVGNTIIICDLVSMKGIENSKSKHKAKSGEFVSAWGSIAKYDPTGFSVLSVQAALDSRSAHLFAMGKGVTIGRRFQMSL